MAEERFRLTAEINDQFTGPLAKLNTALQKVASGGQQAAKDMKKDFEGFHGTLSKTVTTMDSMIAPLRSMGAVSLGAGLGLGSIATAVAGFAQSTQSIKIMSTETGLAVNELRAFGNLGARFGVAAETMQGGVRRFSDEMSRLRKRYGETYSDLQAMNLGQLVEKLVAAPNMKSAIDAAMEQLASMGDPVKRRKVAEMLFGSSEIGAVAGQVTGKYRQMMDEIMRMQGTLDERTTKSADEFQKNLSRMGEAAERLKINTLGPILKSLNEIVVAGDRAGIRGNAEAMAGATQDRLKKTQEKRDFLASEAGGGPEKNADRIKSLEREITRLTDEIKRTRENPAGPSGVSAIPMSYSGGGGSMAGLIQRASFGGVPGMGAPGMGRNFGGFGDMGPAFSPRLGGGGGGGVGGGGVAPSVPPLSQGSGGVGIGGADDATINGKTYRYKAFSGGGRDRINSWLAFFQRPVGDGGLGMSLGKARAMVAMMQGESGENLNPEAKGDHRHGIPTAFGTAQWRLERFTALKAQANRMQLPWTDVRVQQQHMRNEMMGQTYGPTYRRILSAPSDEAALEAGIKGFERPQFPGLAAQFRRVHLNRLRRYNMTGEGASDGRVADEPPAERRMGDAMMRRIMPMESPATKAGRGTLHIDFGNAPPGMRARASMDDLFSATTISKQRQLELRGQSDV